MTEYHDVDHGVAVGLPRRFCVIAPIAFVRQHQCAVVFAVMLRSCAGYFLFHVNKGTDVCISLLVRVDIVPISLAY